MPNAAPLRRGDVASARFGPDSENDMRQATARRRAMCSAWADAFGSWATAIEPCSCQMVYCNSKVNSFSPCAPFVSGLFRRRQGGDVELCEPRVRVLLGPQADGAILVERAVEGREEPVIIERDR